MSKFVLKRLEVGPLKANCYLIGNKVTKEAIVVDPGGDPDYISQKLIDLTLTPVAIIATHGHFDHVLGAFALQNNYKIPFWMNEKDEFLLKRQDNTVSHFLGYTYDPPAKVNQDIGKRKKLKLADLEIDVIKTPGHTPGGMSLYIQSLNSVFVGDLIFKDGAVGRTDFGYSDLKELNRSIKKVLSLPKATKIFSGHGDETAVGAEEGYFDK